MCLNAKELLLLYVVKKQGILANVSQSSFSFHDIGVIGVLFLLAVSF